MSHWTKHRFSPRRSSACQFDQAREAAGFTNRNRRNYGNPASPWHGNTEYDVVAFDPQTGKWTKIIDYGAGDMGSTRALTMAVFRDSVIVGSSMFPIASNPPGLLSPVGFEAIRINPDDSWELLVGDYLAQKPPGGVPLPRLPKSRWPGGFGNFLNLYCWSLISDQGVLYLGSIDTSSFLYVLLSDDSLSKSVLALNTAGMKKAVSSLKGPGMKKFSRPYRQLTAPLDVGDPGELDWERIVEPSHAAR